jgi:hypothetical protein
LREVNELADSAAILVGEPLRELGNKLAELQADGRNEETVQSMQGLVDRIMVVSQSFALLTRPKLHEDNQSIPVSRWMEHIHNICMRRAADAGWHFVTRSEPGEGMIEGPLGRLTMLVIACLKEAFDQRAPQPGSYLRLTATLNAEAIYVRIRYPNAPRNGRTQRTSDLEDALRTSLLQELVKSLDVNFSKRRDSDVITLELHWNQAKLR